MKVAILSHFGSFLPSYALHVGWHERAKMMEKYDVDFDFIVNKKCAENSFPRQLNLLPNLSSQRPFGERRDFFRNLYMDILPKYDVILTADLVYQTGGNFLAYNAAMRDVAPALKAWWCHWIHSGWTNKPSKIDYPMSLKYEMPPKSFLVYLNCSELEELAGMYGTTLDFVRCVHNPKDIRSFLGFDPLTNQIIDELDLPHKDAIQVFPFCSTRMDAKGIDGVINCAAALKRKGRRVALILANANSQKRPTEIASKNRYIESKGLIEGKDYLWTCNLTGHKAVPRNVISELFRLSNYFCFTSWRETAGNVFQEAKISGCQLVLSYNLPCLREMGGKDAIYVVTTHKTPGVADGEEGDLQLVTYQPGEDSYWGEIAEILSDKLPDRSHQWYFSFDRIWESQMKPLLEEAYSMTQGGRIE